MPVSAENASLLRRSDDVSRPPAKIAIEPHVGRIVFGLLWVGVGLWLLLSWLPSHRPMTAAEQIIYVAEGARQFEDRTSHQMIDSALYPFANVIAGS